MLDSTDTVGELFVIYVLLVVSAAAIYAGAEGMTFWDGIWWAVVTSTSTGYGDFYPKTTIGRIDGIVLMLSAIFVIVPLIVVRLVQVAVQDRNAFTHEEQEDLKRKIDLLTETLINNQKETS